jgi:hypothetical protein
MTESDKAAEAAQTTQAFNRIAPETVIGWGVDADPDNDPTWPIRDRTGDDGSGLNWTPPEPQSSEVEILQSLEFLRRPAVVGESTPPWGVSGAVRRSAFAYSESQWAHWLLLMLADRIGSVEGVFQDLARGRMPNPLVEMGLAPRARSREAAALTAGVLVVAAAGLFMFARRRRDR